MKLRNPRIADAILRLSGLILLVALATAYGHSIARFAGAAG